MDKEKIFADIQALNNQIIKIGKKEPEAINELARLYHLVFNETFKTGCHNCHIKAFHRLTSLTIEEMKEQQEKQYKLKPGKSFTLNNEFGSDKFYINHNLTDKVAEEHLKNVPEAIELFEVYPKDLNKSAKKEEPKKEEPKKENKKDAE